MRRVCLSGLAGLLLVLGGCGSAGDEGLTEEASAALSDHMAEVRGAVEDEEPAAAQQALDALHAEARNRAEAGEISSQRLAAIGTAVDDVEHWLEEVDAEPEPPPEPEEPEPEEPEEKEPEEKEPEEEEPEEEEPEEKGPDPGDGNNGEGNGEGNNGQGNGNGGDNNGRGNGDDDEEADDG